MTIPGMPELDDLNPWLDALAADDLRLERMQYEGSLLEFVKGAWHLVEPSRDFVCNWHIEELCKALEGVTAKRIRRLIINVPPGTMKSLLVSVFWPAWMWARDPRLRMLSASYGANLTIDFNIKVRDIIQSPWFQKYWNVKLSEDQNAKTQYNTEQKGWRLATSVGGLGTGKHPDFITIDDASTADDALSEAGRSAINTWFDNTVSTRGVVLDVGIVVVGQRLHQEDLPGYLLNKDRASWTLIRFPMRYEKCSCPGGFESAHEDERCVAHKADPHWSPDPRDPRTTEGELLWPALFTEQKVRQLELDLGPDASAGQLQQRPTQLGGTDFKREYFKFVDAGPALKRTVRGWDTAGTEGGGDWTVGVRISEEFEYRGDPERPKARPKLVSTGRFFIEDVVRVQLGPDGVDKTMHSTAEMDGKRVAIREEREGGSAGKTVTNARAKSFRGWDYAEVPVSGSKRVRAKPFRAQCEAGNVYVVRAAWNEPFLQVLCAFPGGKTDDDVDGATCAFNAVLLEPAPTSQRLVF